VCVECALSVVEYVECCCVLLSIDCFECLMSVLGVLSVRRVCVIVFSKQFSYQQRISYPIRVGCKHSLFVLSTRLNTHTMCVCVCVCVCVVCVCARVCVCVCVCCAWVCVECGVLRITTHKTQTVSGLSNNPRILAYSQR